MFNYIKLFQVALLGRSLRNGLTDRWTDVLTFNEAEVRVHVIGTIDRDVKSRAGRTAVRVAVIGLWNR